MIKKKNNLYRTVEDVPVWQLSHQLTLRVYKLTEAFPRAEVYGLTSQIRRSASSVSANISEGFYRNSTKELINFLYNARGSLGETLYHIRLARDLGLLNSSDFESLKNGYNLLGRQLNGWIRSLKLKING
ncbi:MAG: four helix bundle protein [Patescibacteria group bacterium]|nr:MAG: four helix bundle protein [Patescibacteria group bacterium]